MTFPLLSRRTALLCATLIPAQLWADVTPEDVWQNMQDMVAPMGVTLTARATRSGKALMLEDVVYALALPFDAGSVALSVGSLELQARGDGSVDMIYPPAASYTLTFTSPEGISQSGGMGVVYEGIEVIASGSPADVTYTYNVPRMDMTLADIVVPNLIDRLSGQGFVEDYKGSFRTTVGEMVETSGSYTSGAQAFTFAQTVTEDGVQVDTQGKQGAEAMQGDMRFAMPRDGMSILDLAAALRAGLMLEIEGDATGYFSDQSSSVEGQEVMAQSVVTEHYEVRMVLDQSGFGISGPMRNARMDMQLSQPVPLMLGMDIAAFDTDMQIPLLKDDQFAPYRIHLEMTGLSLDESLWAMFDPGAVLPRTPADLVMKASGHARNMVEWLDILNVETAMDTLPGLAVEPQDLTLDSFVLRAAGAEVSGTGAVSFDNSAAPPLPIGTARFDIKGANTLIDTLVSMGLLSDKDASGARMGLAMMTKPAEDGSADRLRSEVEMTAEGHVYVNGNRMK
ncbi:DUF2125 domain-containing protein [Shimia sediminis]|uniref:DUF2125 domain-containing protein n=1 Tax=Shimia sediminis TaxID=2497945 RepID=UPI000F8DBE8A|nr:DUF2125 domain-containing protein [Shimia sediminis]